MAVAFGNLQATTYASRTNTTVTAPSGIVDDDTLVSVLFLLSSNSTVPTAATLPSGFVSAADDLTGTATAPNGGNGWRLQVAKKKAASESGNYTWTHASRSSQAAITRYSGSNGNVNVWSATSSNASNTTRTASGVTTTQPNCMMLYIGFDWADNTTNETPPTGFTERYDDVLLYWADAIQASAGASGDKTNTCNSTSTAPRGAFLIALEAATASNKTLDANSGSYAIGGTAATLKRLRNLAANSGSYSISGTAATLRKLYKVAANSGSYSISGTAATFSRDWNLVANSGSYSISGTAANLEVHRILTAAGSTYSISGTAATLKLGKAIQALSGSIAISGTAASLRLARKLVAESGTYSISGSDITLTKSSDKVVVLDSGAYAINGTAASLTKTIAIVASSGSYTINGQAASLINGRKLVANGSSYSITGSAATFQRSYSVIADSAGYVISGTPAQLYKGDQPIGGGSGRGGLWSMWLKLGQGRSAE